MAIASAVNHERTGFMCTNSRAQPPSLENCMRCAPLRKLPLLPGGHTHTSHFVPWRESVGKRAYSRQAGMRHGASLSAAWSRFAPLSGADERPDRLRGRTRSGSRTGPGLGVRTRGGVGQWPAPLSSPDRRMHDQAYFSQLLQRGGATGVGIIRKLPEGRIRTAPTDQPQQNQGQLHRWVRGGSATLASERYFYRSAGPRYCQVALIHCSCNATLGRDITEEPPIPRTLPVIRQITSLVRFLKTKSAEMGNTR